PMACPSMGRAGWVGAATVPLASGRDWPPWTKIDQLRAPEWSPGPTEKTYACPEMARHTTPTASPAETDPGWTVLDTATFTRSIGGVAPKSGRGATLPGPLSWTA